MKRNGLLGFGIIQLIIGVDFFEKYSCRTVNAFLSKSRFLMTGRTDLAQILLKSV